jgi:hypothetical protein
LTFREFWRQHFDYGRGAWDVRIRHDQGLARFKVEPSFYGELARQVWRRRGDRGVSMAAIAVISQVAYAAGFASRISRGERSGAGRPELSEVGR